MANLIENTQRYYEIYSLLLSLCVAQAVTRPLFGRYPVRTSVGVLTILTGFQWLLKDSPRKFRNICLILDHERCLPAYSNSLLTLNHSSYAVLPELLTAPLKHCS
jgi:hypothetical protein